MSNIEDVPISRHKLYGPKYFLGLFGGEHVAGTEFIIGASFVAWGVSTIDILIGLAIGNLLAVLSWTFICAPIAVDTRLTLYSYLKKIAGPSMQKIYNGVNGVLYCVLGGAMITVSASAVRILLNIPTQIAWYPTSITFVLLVLALGTVVTVVAAYGFKAITIASMVASPWLLLIFICGALVGLAILTGLSPFVDKIGSWGDLMYLANSVVWTGQSSIEGQSSLTLWHMIGFSWIANLAMHASLSDMAIFRYAKSYKYGYTSALGMFFGHYLAWLCAGIMGAAAALALKIPLGQLDAGAVAYQVLGSLGIIAVIIAGWTTSGPTLYRSGLAFHTLAPNASLKKVTIITGVITTIIACFPFIFTKGLDFIGLYGLLVLPMGTIVFTEHWLFPKIGYSRYWASYKALALNKAALYSWILSIAFAFFLMNVLHVHLFFLALPVWFCTMAIYIFLAGKMGAKDIYKKEQQADAEVHRALLIRQDEDFVREKPSSVVPSSSSKKLSLIIVGVIALAFLIGGLVMAIMVYRGELGVEAYKKYALIPTLCYFIFATLYVIGDEKTDK